MKERWSDLNVKDKISYVIAIGLITSGVVMAFLSFFLNAFNIATGVLIYIAQCFVVGGSIIGVSAYFKSKWVEFNTNTKTEIDKKIEQLTDKIETHLLND